LNLTHCHFLQMGVPSDADRLPATSMTAFAKD
jgi:hypothetical protein